MRLYNKKRVTAEFIHHNGRSFLKTDWTNGEFIEVELRRVGKSHKLKVQPVFSKLDFGKNWEKN